MVKGKWLGAMAGWAFAGPFGAFLGYSLGSMFEAKKMNSGASFELALLGLSSVVIKADGKIKKEELNYVKNFFSQNFGEAKAKMYFKVFNDLKDNIDNQYPSEIIDGNIRGGNVGIFCIE